MELYTYVLNPNDDPTQPGTFDKIDIIEDYTSTIWTERYYGDSECEIVLPSKSPIVSKLPLNIFLGIDESDELMILETIEPQEDDLKFSGISLLSWMNNRFIRTSPKHKAKRWVIKNMAPGEILWYMLSSMVGVDSEFLTLENTDIPQKYLDKLKIPEIGLDEFDSSDDPITVKASFGPLYDEMKKVAQTYQIGMRIFLDSLTPDPDTPLAFRSYKGVDRTTGNSTPDQNLFVQFSSKLNSLEHVQELRSQSIYKTLVFAFASGANADLGDFDEGRAGVAYLEGADVSDDFSGFNCRAEQVLADDITGYGANAIAQATDLTSDEVQELGEVLNAVAKNELAKDVLIQAVDGEIVENGVFQYGRDFSLGDLVEYQADDGLTTVTRVTEHIISNDSGGTRKYETFNQDGEDINATL